MSHLTQPFMDRSVFTTSLDILLSKIVPQDNFELLVIPGGAQGAETLSRDSRVQSLIQGYIKAGKYVGMICAG